MKKIFYSFIFLIINSFILTEKLKTINSDTTQIIEQQNKIIYITNDDNDDNIHIYDSKSSENKNVLSSTIKKSKILLSLNEEKFILFGYNDENNLNLFFNIYNSSNDFNITKEGYFNNVKLNPKINIKMINENLFLLYYFDNNIIYLFQLNIDTSQEQNHFSIEINIPSEYAFNTLECEAFNGENIFCVYSLISSNSIKFYYFFKKFSSNEIKFIEINNVENIIAVSINKLIINEKNKYIICFISNSLGKNQLQCSTFYETNKQDNQLFNDIKTIDDNLEFNVLEKNYRNNIPIKILLI